MALQIRRGTNVQRLLYTPLIGEMVFVTDYQTAGSDPIYVGDGATPGGVAVGQNAVLGGNVEDDINLNTNDIIGTGNINITGNISNLGNSQTRKITITGNGGVAVVSTGSITSTGNLNVTGDILVDGDIEGINITGELHGTLVSDDNATILVNAATNSFAGETIVLSGGNGVATINGESLVFDNADPIANFTYGTEAKPFAPAFYEQQVTRHYGKLVGTGNDVTFPGGSLYLTYRGTLAAPTTIQTGDRLQGTVIQSFNNSNALAGPAFAGAALWIAEDQTGAAAGIVPSTFVLGSGADVAQAMLVDRTETAGTNNALKYTSKGVLGVTSINLRALGNAERTALTPFVDEGTIIYNYEPTNQNGDPLGQGGLQIRVGSGPGGVWYNIPLGSAANV
jgi:hypothetical protein